MTNESRKSASDKRASRLAAAALFALSFAVYLATLPKTVSFEDSAEFVTASAVLGIAHPSGYPLYVLLGKLFTFLPFGTIPWRVALLSAVCASAALAFAYLTAEGLVRLAGVELGRTGRAAMVLVLLQPAFAEIWWSQAVYAKVYALHALLLILIAWLLTGFASGRGRDRLYAAAFVFGLACSNHLFLALAAAPGFALFAAAGTAPWNKAGLWLKLAGCWAAGLLPYVLLPLRGWSGAPYMMGEVNGWIGLACHILRCRYDDVAQGAWNKVGLTTDMLWQLAVALGPLLLVLAGFWFFRLAKVRGRGWLLSAGCLAAVAAAPLALAFRGMDWSSDNSYMARVYALPGFVFGAILAAAGAAAAMAWLGSRRQRVIVVFLLALLPVLTLSGNWERIAAYRDQLPDRLGRALLTSLPPNSVLAVNDYNFIQDTELFVLAYLQVVERVRTDVTVVQDAGIIPFYMPDLPFGYAEAASPVRRRLLIEAIVKDPKLAGRPVYSTYAPEAGNGGWISRSNGLEFEVEPGPAGARPMSVVRIGLPPDGLLRSQPVLGLLAAHVLYAWAAAAAETGDSAAATKDLVRAISLDTVPFSDDYVGFMAHRAAYRRLLAQPSAAGVK